MNFIMRLFEAWEEAGIRYLILRSYEGLPDSIDNDLDILIEKRGFQRALKLVTTVSEECQYSIHNRCSFACEAIYLHHLETLEQIHLDLMMDVEWHLFPMVDPQELLLNRRKMKNFHIPLPEHEAMVSLLTRLAYCGTVKEKYKDSIQQTAKNQEQEFSNALAVSYGKMGREIATAASTGNWDFIERRHGRVRLRIVKNAVLKGGRTIISCLEACRRVSVRWVAPPGLCLVFFGPDGCGKTSVAQVLKQRLSKTFPVDQNVHLHWKPSIIKWWKGNGGDLNYQNPDPHKNKPRSLPGSIVFFLIHLFEYIVGWWIRIHPSLFKNRLVMIDRYYYDFFVDMRRYRLNLPLWMLKLGFVFVKKPDLVFCLDADPEILQARKKEVSFEECKRQREAYRDMASNLRNGHVIDASQPLERVVDEVERIVFAYMTSRMDGRKRF